MSDYNEAPEYIPISYLNAYAHCPRRFYYEFTLSEMLVNEHVLGGQQLHERVDLPGRSVRDEKIQLRHIYLCAPKLGLIGYSDLLEGEADTTDLPTLAAENKLYPVEYKIRPCATLRPGTFSGFSHQGFVISGRNGTSAPPLAASAHAVQADR